MYNIKKLNFKIMYNIMKKEENIEEENNVMSDKK